MQAIKRSVGVTPKVNLRNLLHPGKETWNRGIQSGFETQGRCHHKSKTGVSVVQQIGLMSSKNVREKIHKNRTCGPLNAIFFLTNFPWDGVLVPSLAPPKLLVNIAELTVWCKDYCPMIWRFSLNHTSSVRFVIFLKSFQWQIQDFPAGRANSKRLGCPPIILFPKTPWK